ncbi:unnamed protein product [Trichogramma brassicae]|uniref:Uncharacterized protein n=1 Tax=Trichogramma brassicae TaxID=86971 RepID=A0A6H5IU40_9HYME|nr:unnamed protein product [Trichogramma brassicae]
MRSDSNCCLSSRLHKGDANCDTVAFRCPATAARKTAWTRSGLFTRKFNRKGRQQWIYVCSASRAASRAYMIKETRSRACRTHSTYYLLRCIRSGCLHDLSLSIRPFGCPRHCCTSNHPRRDDRRRERRGGGGRGQLQRQLPDDQRRAAQPRGQSQRLRQLLRLRPGHTRDHAVPGRAALQRRGEGLRLADQRLLRQHLRRLSQLAVLHASPRAPSTGRQ